MLRDIYEATNHPPGNLVVLDGPRCQGFGASFYFRGVSTCSQRVLSQADKLSAVEGEATN